MYNRSVFGALSRYTRSCEGKDCIHGRYSLQCSIGMKSGTLPLTSPSQRILSEKLRYPCFSQVPAGSDCPLPCLYCISRYNSLIVTVLFFAGFRKHRAQIAPLTDLLYISRFILLVSTVLRFASLLVPAGSDCPLPCLYCISRYNSLIVTVLFFAGFRKHRAQIAPLTDLLYISRFILLVSTVLRFASLASTGGLRLPLFKAYRVNIAPYYLFTLKNTFHYRKLYDIRVFVWLVFSSSIHIEGYLNGEFLEFCV